MRRTFLALAASAFVLGACTSPGTQTSTAPAAPPPPKSGPVTTPSGKLRIALLLPLSGRAAPLGQSLQQAAELALFESGAKDIALAAYDSGDTAEAALQAYRKAKTDGVALVLGPLFGTSASALVNEVRQGGANVISFSNDETVAQPGVWVMGIAAPPQVRRVVDHAIAQGIRRFAAFAPNTAYGEQMSRTLDSHVAVRGGTVVAVELYDAESPDLAVAARRLAGEIKGEGKLAILVPVAPPRLSSALTSLAAAGLDSRSVQLIGTGVWDVGGIQQETMLRGAWYGAPDPARRLDFERRFLATYGRPPHRLATLAYDAVALAGHLARMKPGGDFTPDAITNANGWAGVDGAFRFFPDGRTERALAVIEIQGDKVIVVSPAQGSFSRVVN
jgi:branched-chain amino acid transport system substrate-binding protein